MAQPEVIAIGELLVEIMRKRVDSQLDRPGAVKWIALLVSRSESALPVT